MVDMGPGLRREIAAAIKAQAERAALFRRLSLRIVADNIDSHYPD
jgi:hypothetical protein